MELLEMASNVVSSGEDARHGRKRANIQVVGLVIMTWRWSKLTAKETVLSIPLAAKHAEPCHLRLKAKFALMMFPVVDEVEKFITPCARKCLRETVDIGLMLNHESPHVPRLGHLNTTVRFDICLWRRNFLVRIRESPVPELANDEASFELASDPTDCDQAQ